MKNTIRALLLIILIAFFMYIYVESNSYQGMAEFCLSEVVSSEKIREALEQSQVYDYLIIYDLYNKENSKIYIGNMNLLLARKIKEITNIEFSDREVLMGDRFAKKNYSYNPIGQKHIFDNKEYNIDAIIKNSDDVYYGDLNLLENQNIKRQRIYAVLKDENGVEIEENTMLSVFKSNGILPDKHIYYNNISKHLLKLIILCLLSLFIYSGYNAIKKLKKMLNIIFSGYKNNKYSIDIREFISERESLMTIRSALLYFISLFILAPCSIALLIKYINIRMPYIFNSVSPKSLYNIIKSFFDLISYYLHNGITEMSLIVFKVVFFMFISLILFALVIIFKKQIDETTNLCYNVLRR